MDDTSQRGRFPSTIAATRASARSGMLNAILAVRCLILVASSSYADDAPIDYQPTAENLAARQWFQDAKFGIFIHWGVYSELGRGEWVMHNEKMTIKQYKPLATKFNPVDYDPAEWVALFKRAGAKYITITSKHHDGFAMWDSKVTDWDIVDATPYGKDILKPLAEECKKQGMKLFFYHSHLDWTHKDYYPRGRTGAHSGRPDQGRFDRYIDFMDSQLGELLGGEYGEIAGIWFDGWWDQQDKSSGNPKNTHVDWQLPSTYKLIHGMQPACLIGNNHHVAPFSGEDFQMFERDLPGQNTTGYSEDAVIGKLPLETCDTINGAWGYNAEDKNVKSTRDLIHYLVRAAGQNANLLLNVGPKPDGTIQTEFVDRLEGIGRWLDKYGETIRGTRGGPVRPQPWGVATQRESVVFLHLLNLPDADKDGWIELSDTASVEVNGVRVFGSNAAVPSRRGANKNLQIRLAAGMSGKIDTALVTRVSGRSLWSVSEEPTRRPYKDVAWRIPGVIEAEDFDAGEPDVTYFDLDERNLGAEYYRDPTQIDIEERSDASGGFGVGWTQMREWLTYSVDVRQAGKYSVLVPVASAGARGTFHLEFDGVDVTGSISIPY